MTNSKVHLECKSLYSIGFMMGQIDFMGEPVEIKNISGFDRFVKDTKDYCRGYEMGKRFCEAELKAF